MRGGPKGALTGGVPVLVERVLVGKYEDRHCWLAQHVCGSPENEYPEVGGWPWVLIWSKAGLLSDYQPKSAALTGVTCA